MEDFFLLERDDGTEAGGTFGNSKFYAWSYGGHYRINVDGVQYPALQVGENDVVNYAFEGTHVTSDSMKELGNKWPDKVPLPKGDSSALIATRLEQLCRQTAERPEPEPEPEPDIPTQIAAELDDEDEFEPDSSSWATLNHVVNGKKLFVREIGDEEVPEIKKLRVVKTLPEPPLPKGLLRDTPIRRDRDGDEDRARY